MFQEILHKVTAHVDEVVACMLVDRDAVVVAEIFPGERDERVSELAIELSSLVTTLVKRGGLRSAGPLREFSMSTDHVQALCHRVADDYILLLALSPNGDAARGQTMLRMVAPWVERIL